MKEEDCTLIFAILAFIITVVAIIAGTYIIMHDEKSVDCCKTESHLYICDALLCQEEKENNCSSVKLVCERCCDK